MLLTLMMSASPNVRGKHLIIANEASNIIMRSIISCRVGDASLKCSEFCDINNYKGGLVDHLGCPYILHQSNSNLSNCLVMLVAPIMIRMFKKYILSVHKTANRPVRCLYIYEAIYHSLFSSTITSSEGLLKRTGKALFPNPQLTTMLVPSLL